MITTASDLCAALLVESLHTTEHDGTSYRGGLIGFPVQSHHLTNGIEVSCDAVDALIADGKIVPTRWITTGLHTGRREYTIPVVSPKQDEDEDELDWHDEIRAATGV
jgi:hypothetical protein